MYKPYNQIDAQAKVWVFLSAKPLSNEQIVDIGNSLEAFCQQWQAHGQAVVSSFKLIQNQILVLVGENADGHISGCSIDASVQLMKALGTKHQTDFLNRWLVAETAQGALNIVDFRTEEKAGNRRWPSHFNSKSDLETHLQNHLQKLQDA